MKVHVSTHPRKAGKLSHSLGLSDELAEVEMYKAVLSRPALKDMRVQAVERLKARVLRSSPVRRGGDARGALEGEVHE